MPVIDVKLYDRRVTEESVPKMIEALTNALHETSVSLGLDCQPCMQRVCPLKHHRFMRELTVDRVLGAVDATLGRAKPQAAEAA